MDLQKDLDAVFEDNVIDFAVDVLFEEFVSVFVHINGVFRHRHTFFLV